jgi:hypothetical protein
LQSTTIDENSIKYFSTRRNKIKMKLICSPRITSFCLFKLSHAVLLSSYLKAQLTPKSIDGLMSGSDSFLGKHFFYFQRARFRYSLLRFWVFWSGSLSPLC